MFKSITNTGYNRQTIQSHGARYDHGRLYYFHQYVVAYSFYLYSNILLLEIV